MSKFPKRIAFHVALPEDVDERAWAEQFYPKFAHVVKENDGLPIPVGDFRTVQPRAAEQEEAN